MPFGLSIISRLSATSRLIRGINISSANKYMQSGFHTSSVYFYDESTVGNDNDRLDEDQTFSSINSSYLNKAIMIGDVHWSPKPLENNGNMFAYTFSVMTQRAHRSNTTGRMYINKLYSNAICFKKDLFPIIENKLQQNDRVFVSGHWRSYLKKKENNDDSRPEFGMHVVVEELKIL